VKSTSRNLLLFGGLLLAAFTVSLFIGSVSVPPSDVIAVTVHHISGGALASNECPTQMVFEGFQVPCTSVDLIIWTLRVPEILLAMFVGAGLALAGGTMQGVFRNPLGDPYLLGISSGAALGAAIVLVGGIWLAYENVSTPVFAFLGALGTSLLVLLASRSPRASPETLLLTGVALGAFTAAVITLIITFKGPLDNTVLSFWILGGFGLATWSNVWIVAVGVLVGGILLAMQGRDLNVLQLGDETARGLGLNVEAVRRRLLLISSLVTALCVAFSGIIGFVGLTSPHVVRRLQGPSYSSLLPASAIFGSMFMLVAFDLSQTVVGNGTILPVGVITSFVGGPFFIWILFRRRKR
jgi:iron complex transport system permease protein